MKAIKFSEKELEFLREQYQDELAQAKEYVDQIIEILNKLGVREKAQKEETVEFKVYKKRGPKPKVKVDKPKVEPKKRGRKPKIVVPILETVPEPKPEKKEGKKKVSKVKAGKKAVKKTAPKKKSTKEVIAAPVKEVKIAPKKEVKKVAKKKSIEKQRIDEMATSAKLKLLLDLLLLVYLLNLRSPNFRLCWNL